METIKVEDEFVDYIRELVCDKFDEFELDGYAPVYADDLRFEVQDTQGDDMFSDDEAFAFVLKYPQAALAAIDYAKCHFGSEHIPYMLKSWSRFAENIVDFGINCIVMQMPIVASLRNDYISFDHDTVELLKQQAMAVEFVY